MADDTITPTLERLARAPAYEGPQVDQRTTRRAYRLLSLVETLERDGKLPRDSVTAHARFARDHAIASRMPRCIAGYGDVAGDGTPISQRIEEEGGDLLESRRFDARMRMDRALAALSSQTMRTALMLSVTDDVGLEGIGRACTAYTSRVPAIAAGLVILQECCWQLHLHYDPG